MKIIARFIVLVAMTVSLSNPAMAGFFDYFKPDPKIQKTQEMCTKEEVVYYKIDNDTGSKIELTSEALPSDVILNAKGNGGYEFLRKKILSDNNLKITFDNDSVAHEIPLGNKDEVKQISFKQGDLDINIQAVRKTAKTPYGKIEFNIPAVIVDVIVRRELSLVQGGELQPQGDGTSSGLGNGEQSTCDLKESEKENNDNLQNEEQKTNDKQEQQKPKDYQAAYVDTQFYQSSESNLQFQLDLKNTVSSPYPNEIPNELNNGSVKFAGKLMESSGTSLGIFDETSLVVHASTKGKVSVHGWTFEGSLPGGCSVTLEFDYDGKEYVLKAGFERDISNDWHILRIKSVEKQSAETKEDSTAGNQNKISHDVVYVSTKPYNERNIPAFHLGLKNEVTAPNSCVHSKLEDGEEFVGDLASFDQNLTVYVNGKEVTVPVWKKNGVKNICVFNYNGDEYTLQADLKELPASNKGTCEIQEYVLKITKVTKKEQDSVKKDDSSKKQIEKKQETRQPFIDNGTLLSVPAAFIGPQEWGFNSLKFKLVPHEGNTRAKCAQGDKLYAGQLDDQFKVKVIVNGKEAVDCTNVLITAKGGSVDFEFKGVAYQIDIRATPFQGEGSCKFLGFAGEKEVILSIKGMHIKK